MSGDDGSVAALAVEGTTGRCAVTSLLTDPWWRVDLGKSYSVDVVNITSGANGLADFEIRIGQWFLAHMSKIFFPYSAFELCFCMISATASAINRCAISLGW